MLHNGGKAQRTQRDQSLSFLSRGWARCVDVACSNCLLIFIQFYKSMGAFLHIGYIQTEFTRTQWSLRALQEGLHALREQTLTRKERESHPVKLLDIGLLPWATFLQTLVYLVMQDWPELRSSYRPVMTQTMKNTSKNKNQEFLCTVQWRWSIQD